MEKVYYSSFDFPLLKTVFFASTSKGLCMLDFLTSEQVFLKQLKKLIPGEVIRDRRRHAKILSELERYLRGKLKRFHSPLDLRGTPFQRKVWSELAKIPYGETKSYKEVARAIGHPRAFRAVGNANGANPISIILPCHRVIESDGGLGGYGHGIDLKKQLLDFEQSHR